MRGRVRVLPPAGALLDRVLRRLRRRSARRSSAVRAITVATSGTAVAKALRDAGASTAYWEMQPAGPGGLPELARRSGGNGRRGGRRAAESAGLDGLPESDHRTQRADRLRSGRSAARSRAAVPRRRAGAHARAGRRRGNAIPARFRISSPRRAPRTGGARSARSVGSCRRPTRPRRRSASIGDPFLISRAMRVGLRSWAGRLDRDRHPGLAHRADAGLPVGRSISSAERVFSRPQRGSRSSSWSQQAGVVVARSSGSRRSGRGGGGRTRRFRAVRTPTSPPPPARTCGRATPTLCNAPGLPIPGFDPDLTAGAFQLPARVQCRFTGGSFATSELTALASAGVVPPWRAHRPAGAQHRPQQGDGSARRRSCVRSAA